MFGVYNSVHTACAISVHTGRANSKSEKKREDEKTWECLCAMCICGCMCSCVCVCLGRWVCVHACRPSMPIRSSACAAAYDSILSIYNIHTYNIIFTSTKMNANVYDGVAFYIRVSLRCVCLLLLLSFLGIFFFLFYFWCGWNVQQLTLRTNRNRTAAPAILPKILSEHTRWRFRSAIY